MQISWIRGFFRLWVLLACLWVVGAGWLEYNGTGWNTSVQTKGECWDRLAHWPDGRPFEEFEPHLHEADIPENVEINRKNHAWAADSVSTRNSWLDATLQKIEACEATWPISRRVALLVRDNWLNLSSALSIVFLPPLVLLGCGVAFGWVIRGFRIAA